ncbi:MULTISPECIES: hypothetical protein [Komagataeibacter]|uniref:Uncharacterized protein n=2 Tax=Komagataeibacter TaxID=1434011 RepID=A0A318R096_9PROT|nr:MULTISPECIES: hypothetical protein [Komagataeibacter]MBL7234020.1 hypothetical protein [Komagataeibacter oboediens]MBT0674023.1 hypothetical protein [Komagataeibacter oboediens]MBT0677255.1 hypothetical protein [Komagataeibacter oboediens]MBV0887186.1 hypothetical protein [Komagataeibacter oboediens]MBV1824097.1 hypothetical protein [Komagataeibacter oboediens]
MFNSPPGRTHDALIANSSILQATHGYYETDFITERKHNAFPPNGETATSALTDRKGGEVAFLSRRASTLPQKIPLIIPAEIKREIWKMTGFQYAAIYPKIKRRKIFLNFGAI